MTSMQSLWLPMTMIGFGTLASLVAALWNLRLGRVVRSWPTSEGKVFTASVYRPWWASIGSGAQQSHRTRIAYEYTVGDRRYTGKNIGIGREWISRSEAQQIITPYEPGTVVTVYYCPGKPWYSFLEPGRNTWTQYLFGVVVEAIIFACLTLMALGAIPVR